MLTVREDNVEIGGVVRTAWADTSDPNLPGPEGWNIMVEPGAAHASRLIDASGGRNLLGWINCRVTPIAPYRFEPWRSQLLGQLIGQKVRLAGTWCDQTGLDGAPKGTIIVPVLWIVVDRGLSPIVEEHGFTQVLADYDVYAFSDDGDVLRDPGMVHRREDRHLNIAIQFPPKPQVHSLAVFAECDDREPAEATQYDYKQKVQPKAYPLNHSRLRTYSVVAGPTGDALRLAIDTGNAGNGQGFFYAKLTLSYDEPFEEMCLPDVCLADPAKSCQFTGDYRRTWGWPRLEAARAGDMLLGPASGAGVLGRLLGALQPTQRFDHIVLFVEDDGRTVRHCTASDERLSEEEYINGTVTVKSVFGDMSVKIPLQGLRGDIVRFGWPGSISQSLGEVCITGRNRLNPAFSFASLCAALLTTESAAPFKLWQLAPAERDKRTCFHDPEATATARSAKDGDRRLSFSIRRLQKEPAVRADVGLLWPKLVKPHPFNELQARAALLVVAEAAKKVHAHYRFFGYTASDVAIDPAFNAPAKGDPSWRLDGADWSAGSVAAMCSSFIWAAVQAANGRLRALGKPIILLEGERDLTDERPPADLDGLYDYQQDERVQAGKQLFEFMVDKVAGKIDAKLADLSFPGTAIASLYGDTIENLKNSLASTVANQMCNTFASDDVADFNETWQQTGKGIAVSPDDTFVNWDVNGPSDVAPPAPPVGKVNVYGNSMPIAIPNPGWIDEPVYRVDAVVGQGAVHGRVLRREHEGAPLRRVVGATVRLGCRVTSTDVDGNWAFDPTKAGRYLLRATMFVIDRETGVGLQWASEDQHRLEINNGDLLSGPDLDLELLPPPGVARNVTVQHHADVVDRRVIGKDAWGHFDLRKVLPLAFDPREPPTLPPEHRNTKLSDTYDETTPEVGSGVHVRVTVDARLRRMPGPGGSIHFDGSVELDVHLIFFDSDEGETNGTIDKLGIVVAVNDKYELPYNLVSDDTVPERASGTVVVHNVLSVLP